MRSTRMTTALISETEGSAFLRTHLVAPEIEAGKGTSEIANFMRHWADQSIPVEVQHSQAPQ